MYFHSFYLKTVRPDRLNVIFYLEDLIKLVYGRAKAGVREWIRNFRRVHLPVAAVVEVGVLVEFRKHGLDQGNQLVVLSGLGRELSLNKLKNAREIRFYLSSHK